MDKFKVRVLKKMLLFAFIFYLFMMGKITIYALKSVVSEGKLYTAGGGGGSCTSSKSACYDGSWSNYDGIRFTLVDGNGDKVSYYKDGNLITTRSVDFGRSTDGKYRMTSNPISYTNDYCTNGTTIVKGRDGTDFYDYKYGSTSMDEYLYMSIPHIPTDIGGGTDSDIHWGYFEKAVENQEKLWEIKEIANEPISFLELFLFYSNYYTDESYSDWASTQRYKDLDNYYLLAEPIYYVWSPLNQMCYYGTSTDYLRAMYNGSYNNHIYWGIGHVSVDAFACNFHTPSSSMGLLSGNEISSCAYSYRGDRFGYDQTRAFGDSDKFYDYGYAMWTFDLGEPGGTSTTHESVGTKKVCSSSGSNGDNIVSFKGLEKWGTNIYNSEFVDAFFLDDVFKDEADMHCFDSVSYNFNDMVKGNNETDSSKKIVGLQGEKEKNELVKVAHVEATLTRYCYNDKKVDGKYPASYNDMKNKVLDDYKDTFSVNYAGKNINFNVSLDKENTNIATMGSDKKIAVYSFNLDYAPILEDEQIKISSNLSGKKVGSVVFDKNKMFGKSTKYINQISSGSVEKEYGGGKKFTYKLIINPAENATTSCNFIDYKVGDSVGLPTDNNIKFRVISLNDPFPARNGSGRLPSINWLNEKNYVFDYITNNRGIIYELNKRNGGNLMELEIEDEKIQRKYELNSEEMYNVVEPMYTVTLTPSTMKKIRTYNSKYSYYSMFYTAYKESSTKENEQVRNADRSAYKLNCNSSDGGKTKRECYSRFMRVYFNNDTLSGSCSLFFDGGITGMDDLRDSYNLVAVTIPNADNVDKALGKRMENINAYNSSYDLNKNGRIDTDDVIVARNGSKNTKYYTCANKTFLSGGPLKGSDE